MGLENPAEDQNDGYGTGGEHVDWDDTGKHDDTDDEYEIIWEALRKGDNAAAQAKFDKVKQDIAEKQKMEEERLAAASTNPRSVYQSRELEGKLCNGFSTVFEVFDRFFIRRRLRRRESRNV